MKSIISKTLSLVAIPATLFSFSPNPGGEGFEISLNNKVVIQRYGSDINAVNSLPLNQTASDYQLTVKYHHCGKVGKNRVISIRDGQNNILKQFRYADAAKPVAPMDIPVKDILGLKKGSVNSLKLYYSSSELPNGRMLATIVVGTSAVAKL
jgi:hypothetical protein